MNRKFFGNSRENGKFINFFEILFCVFIHKVYKDYSKMIGNIQRLKYKYSNTRENSCIVVYNPYGLLIDKLSHHEVYFTR